MGQAKGILPRHGEADVMRDKDSNGYFIDVTLAADLARAGVLELLRRLTTTVDEFVAPLPGRQGVRAGAVAVGLARGFFVRPEGGPRFEGPLQVPAAFEFGLVPPLPGEALAGELLLYAITPYEARASAFITTLGDMPGVSAVRLLRGYQRTDDSEPFGYRDGLRNVDRDDRTRVVHIAADRQPEEPVGAEGGSYMAYLRVVQHTEVFAALPPADQDAIIGRTRDGYRLDLVEVAIDAHEEPADPPPATPPTAHVGKVGPRGRRDDVQIFRRGLPFVETTPDGRVEVGLNFCSFQASPLQLDVVLNDWALNTQFTAQPNDPRGAGADALLDPGRGLTTFQRSAFCFVPPADPRRRHLAATLFDAPPAAAHGGGRPTTGRITVLKRVQSDAQPQARFDRQGFVFRITDPNGQPVGDDLTTDSTGRAVSPELPMNQTYTVTELPSGSVPGVGAPPPPQPVTLDTPTKVLQFINTVPQPGGYGG